MSAPEIFPIPFGQRLGQAARGASALMQDVLARNGTSFQTWVVLNLLATRGEPMPRNAMERQLAAGLETDMAAAAALVDQLAASGLIRAGAADGPSGVEVALTDAGQAEYRRLRDAVNGLTEQLVGDTAPADLQASIRVLTHVKERADALLAR